ncbi:portal protein [Rhizobium sp. BK251]|uniref:portal protein n=1 Tax=Rhizobium sp. BK251 TaxID=2512125 RepID=UPI001048A406|nr:portal protein [Rhizobium sp. BK251]TCL70641.1 head-to-tail connecting protein [Rhizobium sp. BK251]
MLDSRAKELCRIGQSLFAKKAPYDSLCQDIADNYYPLRSDFTRELALGDDFTTGLMESYPVQARETLGNAPSAMLRQGDWFEVKTGREEIDEDPEAARWLEHATKSYRRLVYDRRSNFVAATTEVDHDWVAFGNGVISVEESPTRDHMLFRAWHPRDCAWMLNEVGKVDHLQRKMKKTARNLKKLYKDKVHADIVQACETDPSKEFNVRHILMPVDDIYGDDKIKRRQYRKTPFISIYVDIDHEQILGEAGLPVFNYVVPRWRTLSNIPQGFSPSTINSLPDGRMIQSMARIILEQGEKAVDPPTVAKGEMFRDAVNMYAGGMTYVDLEADDDIRKLFQTIETGNVSIGMEMKQDVREMIAEAFLLNKLFLPDTREMTAYETQQRIAEFRRAALPFFGPIESEYHLPLLDTGFQLALHNRQFELGELPDLLDGEETTFSFESPLNTAEGRQLVASFQESVQILAGAAQFDKTIPSTMDFKKMTKDAVKGTGAPADWFNDEEVQQSEEQQQNAVDGLTQAAAALREGAGVATDVAGASVALQNAGLA